MIPPHQASRESLLRVVNDRGVMDALGVVTVARMGVLFAGEVLLLGSRAPYATALLPVLATGVCWACYQGLRRRLPLFLHDWFLTCVDLVVGCLLLLSAVSYADNLRALWSSYALVSAVFIGLAMSSLWPAVWASGIISWIAVCGVAGDSVRGSSFLMSLGIVSSVVLGNKWRRKVWDIGELSAEVASAREERRAMAERLSIARDLHDSLAKSVHGIRMLSETLDGALREEGHTCALLSRTLFESADEASREARIVLDGLRVGGEDNTVAALEEAVVRWGDRSSITPVFDIDSTLGALRSTPEAMWQLHRIVGEALVNAEKHSGARHVYFTAKRLGEDLLIEISDDGRGLPASVIAGKGRVGHYGFQGMKERADSLGAWLEVSSRSENGAGLCLRLVVPLRALGMSRR